MRSFIAIELPQDIQDSLFKAQACLKDADADINWVKRENLHITLKFLGDIDERQAEYVSGSLSTLARETSAYPLSISSCAAFPNTHLPRIIYATIDTGYAQTKILSEKIETILRGRFPEEKREFIPHITLGRVISKGNLRGLIRRIETFPVKKYLPLEFNAEKIIFLKSVLKKEGAFYETLKEENLRTN